MKAGAAALAMWWDMAAGMREDFEHWHSHEHFPERLALPGFERASRWADARGGEGFFVLYELADYGALVSPEYLARLNAPTEWSRRLMPHHRHMVRSPSRVLASRGAAIAGEVLTVRLSPSDGASALQAWLEAGVQRWPALPGIAGAHLLQTDAPSLAPTTEQRIRGLADRTADWILLVQAYDAGALDALAQSELSAAALQARGAAAEPLPGRYALRLSMRAGEAG
jgi:hypothetical protein